MKKIYKANDCLSVPIVKNGKIVQRLSFNDAEHTLHVFDKATQDALEALPCFKKLFHISFEEKEEEKENPVNTKNNSDNKVNSKEYPEVENVQDAKNILIKQYNIPYQGLRSPETILKKAQELGVSFPNIKV